MTVTVAHKVVDPAQCQRPADLWVVGHSYPSTVQLQFGKVPVQCHLREPGCHTRQEELIPIVVAKDSVDRPRKSLSDLGQGEWRAEIAAEDEGVSLQCSQKRFQFPDVVVNVR